MTPDHAKQGGGQHRRRIDVSERTGRVNSSLEAAYRGHGICVEADERRPDCWGWSYLIDGRISSVSRISLCPGLEGFGCQFGRKRRYAIDKSSFPFAAPVLVDSVCKVAVQPKTST